MDSSYQVLPPLTAEEYAALRSDIRERGVLVPVEYDEDGNILDGFHRVKACQDLGITDWPRSIRSGLTEEQKLELAWRLNVARRQLDKGQKQQLAVQLRDEGWTQERIALALCVSQGTISMWLTQFINFNKLPPSLRIHGKDGKRYPGRKPRRALAQPTPRAQPTGKGAQISPPTTQGPGQSEPEACVPLGAPTEGALPHVATPPQGGQGEGLTRQEASSRPPVSSADASESALEPETPLRQGGPWETAAVHLWTFVEALAVYLHSQAAQEELARASGSWSRQAKAEYLAKVTGVIGQLQGLHEVLTCEVRHDCSGLAGEPCPHDNGPCPTDQFGDDTPGDDDADGSSLTPDEVDGVPTDTVSDPHDDGCPHGSSSEVPTAGPGAAADEGGPGMPEKEAAEQRIEQLAANGLSKSAIARQLNQEGVVFPNGNGQWDHRKVARARLRATLGS